MAKGSLATSMVPLSTPNTQYRECHHPKMHQDGLGMLLVRLATSDVDNITLVHAARPST